VQNVLDRLHKAYPWLTVRLVQGKTDFDVLQGIYSGHRRTLRCLPDRRTSRNSATRRDARPGSGSQKDGHRSGEGYPAACAENRQLQGKDVRTPVADRMRMPLLQQDDVQEGRHHAPTAQPWPSWRRRQETHDLYSDGSIKVAGFVPLSSFYHRTRWIGPAFGAEQV